MSSSFLQNAFLAWILSVCCFPNVSLKKRLTVAFQKGAHKQEGHRAKGNGLYSPMPSMRTSSRQQHVITAGWR